jgi:hypothetical protein
MSLFIGVRDSGRRKCGIDLLFKGNSLALACGLWPTTRNGRGGMEREPMKSMVHSVSSVLTDAATGFIVEG